MCRLRFPPVAYGNSRMITFQQTELLGCDLTVNYLSTIKMAERSFFVCLLCILGVLSSVWGNLSPDFDLKSALQKPENDKCKGKVENCYCAEGVIDCNGPAVTDITSLYPFISTNVSRISINGARFREIPDNLFQTHHGQHFNKLTYLDLSNNHIQILGKNAFRSLPKLKTLDLSNNNIEFGLFETKSNGGPFARLKHLHELRLHGTFNVMDQAWPNDAGDLFNETHFPHLEVLDISSNGFALHNGKRFQNFLCANSVTLKKLNLAGNSFDRMFVPPCMDNMFSLDYSNNSLEYLTPVEMDVIESFISADEIKLGGNPFGCDCMFIDTQDWMNTTTRPLDFKKIVCGRNAYNATMVGKPVLEVLLNASEVCEEPRIIVCGFGPLGTLHLAHSTFIAIVTGSCVLVVAAIVGLMVFIRWKRRKTYHGATRVPTEGTKIPPYDRMI